MKKIKIGLIAIVACICVYGVVSFISDRIKYQNVFDEMFYSYWEEDVTKSKTATVWRNDERLDVLLLSTPTAQYMTGKTIDFEELIPEVNENSEIDITDFGMYFIANEDDTNKKMRIYYGYKLNENVSASVSYDYYGDDKVLVRKIELYEDSELITDDDKIDEMLVEANYKREELYDLLDYVLYEQVLPCWFDVAGNDSFFSIDNLGNVEIEK